MLPENAPVRRTSAQLEELDYRKLYEAYSPKGRKSVVDPKVMFKVTAYAYECGIYSTRQMKEACRYRIDFMWLLEDHMRNGQLKPAYNVQIAVNSEYITGIEVLSNCTDFGTLAPFLEEISSQHGCRYEKVKKRPFPRGRRSPWRTS